jgi:hypothetical protein
VEELTSDITSIQHWTITGQHGALWLLVDLRNSASIYGQGGAVGGKDVEDGLSEDRALALEGVAGEGTADRTGEVFDLRRGTVDRRGRGAFKSRRNGLRGVQSFRS